MKLSDRFNELYQITESDKIEYEKILSQRLQHHIEVERQQFAEYRNDMASLIKMAKDRLSQPSDLSDVQKQQYTEMIELANKLVKVLQSHEQSYKPQ